MSTLGDVKVILSLDIVPFTEGMKSALRIGEAGGKQLQDILSLKPGASAEFTVFDAEIKKLADTLKDEVAPAAQETEAKLNDLADQLENNSGNAFKTLNGAIKQAKADVLEFGANTVTASDSTKTYGQVLRGLVEEKKILARQTKQAGEQFSGFASSLGIAGMNVRNIITDIRNLNAEEQSTSEFAMSVAQIGVSALAAAPAISQLNIQWKALGGTGMFLGGSVLPTILSGVVAVTSAYGMMIGHIVHLKDELGRIGQVLSGQMSYWDALKMNLRDVSFGLIDLTDNADNATRSLQQLLSLSVSSGKQFQNQLDLQNYEAKFQKGGEFFNAGYSKEEIKALIDNYKALQNVKTEYEQQQEREDQSKKNQTELNYEQSKKKNSGSSSRYKTESEELDQVAQKQKELIKIQAEYDDAVAKGYKGYADDLKIKLDEIKKQIEYLINGAKEKSFDGFEPKRIKDETGVLDSSRGAQLIAIEELLSEKRIGLIQNEYDKKIELINKAYFEELRLINTRGGKYQGATDGQLERAKGMVELEFMQQIADLDAARWTKSINGATQVFQILSKRPTNLFGYLAQAISMAATFASLMGLASAGPLGAVAGLFGFLGGLFDGGGHTGGTNPRRAAGIVHEQEWVAPAWMLNSMPQTFAMLEGMRRSGSVGRSSSTPGYYGGGRVSYPSNYTSNTGDGNITIELYSETTDHLLAKNTSRGNKKLLKINTKAKLK
ncbi:MAG: hypothetical protein IAE90_07490 [Ignavibacteria bacterium]|nr:hypothetical protein [Ignavibacteria bacterium]